MTGTTDSRIQEIYRRTKQYRQRLERRVLSMLTACTLLLLTGIGQLLQQVQTPGISTVANAYGAVLLRNDVGAYIVLGIVAFAAGVAFTVICIRWKKK